MKTSHSVLLLAILAGMASDCLAQAQTAATPRSAASSKIQPVLISAAQKGQFTFIVFTKGDTPASREMLATVKQGVAARPDDTTYITAEVSAASERAHVERYGVGRAPMPLTVAVAPNGAVTGVFSKSIVDQQLTDSLVPPTMMRCMKSLQDKKLVFVCLTQTADETATVPAGVQSLQNDPEFKDRLEMVSMCVNDPQETRFIDQMKIQPDQVTGPYAVLIAPPGVLIGHYDSQAQAGDIAAALHKAGKCCDDPHCKHNHAAPKKSAAPQSPARK